MGKLFSSIFQKKGWLIITITFLISCEGGLEPFVYDRYSSTTFFQTAEDAKASVTSVYRGLRMWETGYSAGLAYNQQAALQTYELTYNFVGGGKPYSNLDLKEDNDQLTHNYEVGMPLVTETTIYMDKISKIAMNDKLKNRYIAELKAVRAMVSQMLFSVYGPVPIRIDPVVAEDPSSEPIPRPTREWMISQIEKDFQEAIEVLPVEYDDVDYGRITKGACYMGLMKLYMREKRWGDVITVGKKIQALGYQLIPNYSDNFTIGNATGNSEIILALPCRFDSYSNGWLSRVLPSSYVDPTGHLLPFDGYLLMPWETYDRFEPNDKRSEKILASWPSHDGEIVDGRAEGYLGAIPMKYGSDPASRSWAQGVNTVVWRYADVLLSLAEAINEIDGPTEEAYGLINIIRKRAGVNEYTIGTLNKEQFRNRLMDERFFELWCESSILKEDMIRWGTFIQNVIDRGSEFAKPEFILYPLPRRAMDESKGVIKQNPGY